MKRPHPPKGLGLFNEGDDYPISFAPAPDVADWLLSTIIDPGGELHNEDHQHLIDAAPAVLWAAGGFTKQGRTVVGQAEQVTFRCGPWQKGRQKQQMTQWFGRVPSYLITLDASYCVQCSDADFCALIARSTHRLLGRRAGSRGLRPRHTCFEGEEQKQHDPHDGSRCVTQ